MASKNTGIVPVDVGRLSSGLQTMFNGMSEVFGSIGAGEEAVAMIAAGATKADKPESANPGESVQKKAAATSEPVKDEAPKPSAPEPAANPELKKAEAPEPTASASTLTLVDLQKIAGQKILANRANQEKIQKIISSFGISKLSDLPENKYEAFMTQLTTL